MIPPLAIIQARVHSSRIPVKMLEVVARKPLLWHGWNLAASLFGVGNTVIACPLSDAAQVRSICPEALVCGYAGDASDVLRRIWHCAVMFRSDPASPIVRITPDDFPIDPWREVCLLAELDHWHQTVTDAYTREHIGDLFHPRVEINTPDDLSALRRRMGE